MDPWFLMIIILNKYSWIEKIKIIINLGQTRKIIILILTQKLWKIKLEILKLNL